MTLVLIYIRETIKLKVKVDRERPIIILKQFLILKKKERKKDIVLKKLIIIST